MGTPDLGLSLVRNFACQQREDILHEGYSASVTWWTVILEVKRTLFDG
jgi:hypothetical protein